MHCFYVKRLDTEKLRPTVTKSAVLIEKQEQKLEPEIWSRKAWIEDNGICSRCCLSFFFFFFCNTLPITTLHLIQIFHSAVNLYFSWKVPCCLLGIMERIQSTENIFMRRHYYIHIVKCVARWIYDFIPLSQKCSIMNTAILFTNIPGK